MTKLSTREILIRMARRREKKLGFGKDDRKELLGTTGWAPQSDSDIQAYARILDEELRLSKGF